MKDQRIDFSDAGVKQLFFNFLKTLTGEHRVTITKYRKVRSKEQNAYWHAALVAPFLEWLLEQGTEIDGIPIDHDDAHAMLRDKFLPKKSAVTKTGEIISEQVASTRNLNTTEFNVLIEVASRWMAEFCEIVVLPPRYKWDK